MTCMRARDYLHLVKWLDSRGCNTLKTFVLRYQLNIADTEDPHVYFTATIKDNHD